MPIYTLHHQVRRLDEELCGNGRKYSTEDVLFSGRGKRIVLGKLIAEGGEGSVFTAHAASASPLVAKLYHPNQRMRWREQKLRLMCSRPIRSPWREILYDELRRFVGVLMPRADGVPLGAFAFHAELLQKQFPSWTRYDLTRLCLNLSESVHTLHRYGVVLGDLHPGNVMVSPDGSVCWVDADSFQIEDYPCSVGTEQFRAPELHGNFGDFLRTRSHDAYALSVLLFMTLALGLSPFARQGSEEDMLESVGKGVLPYPFASYKPPTGFYPPDTPGRYVWSYLPRKLRDALGHNFTCVQRRDLRPRVIPGYLARCLQQYLRDMEPDGRRDHPIYREILHDRPCPPRNLMEQMIPNICTDCGIRFREAPDDVARRLRQSHAKSLCKLCIRRRSALNQAFRNSTTNH
ncbi:hypothetical protein [Akkermansia muciniphila]|uniref:hypothetical protein n=1 Tax=Akkermansia muciniphila TaxID=239935 RepID=UPI000C9BB7B2|nr:hypothetical protein [Akkermansia muciniphila]PNC05904.1 hypothetical protein CXU21_02305 [Akkermansia muciniphila]